MKRKPVEAWVVVGADGVYGLAFRSRALAEGQIAIFERGCVGGPWEVVRLVEHDPRAAAVVRAAAKWVAQWPEARRRTVGAMVLSEAVQELRAKR